MRAVLAIAFAAACGGSHAAPPPMGTEPLAGSAADVPKRETPPPVIEWKDHAFATDMLPAVAKAGEVVVVPVRITDERGYANLTLEVRDRTDTTVQTIQVMTPNEYESFAPGGTPSAALTRRIAAANAELARLHGVHDLVAMGPMEIQPPTGTTAAHLAMGDGLDVDWNADHVHIFRHNQDRPVFTRDGHKWLAPSHVSQAGAGTCDFPSFLRAAYHAPQLSVVVVQLAYKSPSDACGVPSDQFHVVAW
ncbi:MAG: hypothetical protein ABJE66_14665 [Deltaproteobacteria bacterium]